MGGGLTRPNSMGRSMIVALRRLTPMWIAPKPVKTQSGVAGNGVSSSRPVLRRWLTN